MEDLNYKQIDTEKIKKYIAARPEGVLVDKHKALSEFGRLLDYSWKLKRGISTGISTGSIDAMYQKGVEAGALGGKLLGAGGGGFLLFYVEPDRQAAVREAMRDLLYIPFAFENNGTTVIHYAPESYEPKEQAAE